MQVRSLDQEDPLKNDRATHSSILAWRIPQTGEPGGLQSHRVTGSNMAAATQHARRNLRAERGEKRRVCPGGAYCFLLTLCSLCTKRAIPHLPAGLCICGVDPGHSIIRSREERMENINWLTPQCQHFLYISPLFMILRLCWKDYHGGTHKLPVPWVQHVLQ